jgi:hypothetical protein
MAHLPSWFGLEWHALAWLRLRSSARADDVQFSLPHRSRALLRGVRQSPVAADKRGCVSALFGFASIGLSAGLGRLLAPALKPGA